MTDEFDPPVFLAVLLVLSFFLLRCTDCEKDWTAGDEASVRA